jgi:hypothetical protein
MCVWCVYVMYVVFFACVSVRMRVFCNNFCSLCVSVHLCSREFSTLSTVRFCSFYTQLCLILFIYSSSPLLFNEIPIIIVYDKGDLGAFVCACVSVFLCMCECT